MLIKKVRVTNPKNVLVQVPGFIVNKWNLSENDRLEVHVSEDGKELIVRPKEVQKGVILDNEGKRLVGDTT